MSTTAIDLNTEIVHQMSDKSDMQHYFPKAQISENLMSGSPMEAICGYVHEGQQQDPAALPVCGLCDEIMNIMYGRDESDG